MALTRKALATMGIEEDKIDQIIEMHTGVTTDLKTELDKYKAKADELESVQKELDELKETVAKNSDDPYKVKFEEIKEEFEKYKADVTAKETTAKKESAYKKLLIEAGVGEKYVNSLMKVSSDVIDGIELDEDGKVKDTDKLVEGVKENWADFIVEAKPKGTDTPTPPANNGGSGMTKAEIMAITDRTQRRQAIAENPQLFGIATE